MTDKEIVEKILRKLDINPEWHKKLKRFCFKCRLDENKIYCDCENKNKKEILNELNEEAQAR